MENKSSSSHRMKPQYNTMMGVVFHTIFMMCLLSLLSWFLLVIWFGVDAVLHDGSGVCHSINTIVSSAEKFISCNGRIFKKLVLVEQQFERIILECMNYFVFYIVKILKAIHLDTEFSYQQKSDVIITILFGTAEIVLNRFVIFVMNLPLMLSVMFLFVVDGLGQRDIRKFQGARESAFLFHRMKPVIRKIVGWGFLFYLCIPFAIQSQVILRPMVIVLGVLVMVLIQNYKKYA